MRLEGDWLVERVDDLKVAADGSILGRSTLGGRELGRFRMVSSGYHDGVRREGGS